jgi:putative heme-binding domain-containing protein
LAKVAVKDTHPADVRLEALAAIPGGLPDVSPSTFAFLRAQLPPDQPVSARIAAADVLAKSTLSGAQRTELVEALKAASPLEVDRLLSALEQAPEDELGLKVVAALKSSPALASLRTETLKPHHAKFSPRVHTAAEELYATLNVDAAKQRARLEEMLTSMAAGDVRRGQLVFNGTKAACSACHAIGYLGGNVGPDLTRIAQIRSDRDLLEAIVFPSASFVRSYEPVLVATKEGKVINGLIRKDSADEMVLATGPNEEARIARDAVEEIRPGTVSVMPAGLDQQLTTQDLADLLAFLKTCK